MTKAHINWIFFFTILLSAIMHSPHFSKDLVSIHVWRQTQTQSTTISFYEEDMNILNPRKNNRGETTGIFRMEFPLFQWINAILFKLFGNHILVTRLYLFFISFFCILGIFNLLKHLFQNNLIALIGSIAFTFSPSYFYHSINPLPDNLALCFSFWGLAFFIKWLNKKRYNLLIFAGLLLTLAALCKLPYILYFIVPFVFFLSTLMKSGISKQLIINSVSLFSFSILVFGWYLWVIPDWTGNPIVKGMFDNSETLLQLLDYLIHNIISTLPELLLNFSIIPLFLAGVYFFFFKKLYRSSKFHMFFWLFMGLASYFLFEINAIGKVHDYYLFPFYPLLWMMVGYGGYQLVNLKLPIAKYLVLLAIILSPITCYLRLANRWDTKHPGFNKDLLIYKEDLQKATPKNDLVIVGNDNSTFIFLYYIDKKGWVFDQDNLTVNDLSKFIDHGAKYLYTDSEKFKNNTEFNTLLDKVILKKGSISVFQLKRK